jgi:hypothetical protein
LQKRYDGPGNLRLRVNYQLGKLSFYH